MNISTSTQIPSVRNRTLKALLLGATAFAVSGFATAHESAPHPTPITYQVALQAKIAPPQIDNEAGSRSDWNVDYPSQLGPQAVRLTNDMVPNKVASTVDKDANEQF